MPAGEDASWRRARLEFLVGKVGDFDFLGAIGLADVFHFNDRNC